MVFANPLFLVGLFALTIPILIHLFNFRRVTRVWFTNVRFLKEIKQETQKRSQLKQWLLLATRLLAIASLVIAFAQPYIPAPTQSAPVTDQHAVAIYLDNSFSMNAEGPSGKILETARNKAREIVAGYGPSDQFLLLTNDADPRHQRMVSRDQFLEMLDEVTSSPRVQPLSRIIKQLQDLLSESGLASKNLFLLSDFQKSTCDLSQFIPDSGYAYFLLPVQATVNHNLFIDTLFFTSIVQQPDQLSTMTIRLRNEGSERLEKIPVKLSVEGQQLALGSIDIEPFSENEVTLSFRNPADSWTAGSVIIPDYPITFDDKCYFAYPLISRIPILGIYHHKPNPYLTALFETDSAFNFSQKSVERLDYASLPDHALIILDQIPEVSSGLLQALSRYVREGGHLCIVLPADPDQESYHALSALLELPEPGLPDTTRLRVAMIESESALYTDVFEKHTEGPARIPDNADLPEVHMHFSLQSSGNTPVEPLLVLDNQDLFLGQRPLGNGLIYLLTTPLDIPYSTFPNHLLFVPTFFRMALLSQPNPRLYYTTGNNYPIEIPPQEPAAEAIYHISKPNVEGSSVIPEIRQTANRTLLFPHGQVKDAGIYNLIQDQQVKSKLAFNDNRLESWPELYTRDALEKAMAQYPDIRIKLVDIQTPSLQKEIRTLNEGKPLWRWFLILTLLFLAIEVAILRFVP